MKRAKVAPVRVLALFAASAVAGLVPPSPVAGHTPAGSVIKAFQFPDGLVPTIDGDLSDWDVADDFYTVTTSAFRDLVADTSPSEAPSDFAVSLTVGWNENANRIYVAAQVRDDFHQIDRPPGSASVKVFQDDAMEIFIDADHSGGQFADFSNLSQEEQLRTNGTQANHFVIAGPPPDVDFFVNFSAASWYALAAGPFTEAAFALDGQVGGPAVMAYEFSLVPFDGIDIGASFLSRQHDLTELEILGFNVEFDDYDASSELLDAKWSLSGGQNSFRLADRFGDLQLSGLDVRFLPTAVTGTSWGRIKSSFAR